MPALGSGVVSTDLTLDEFAVVWGRLCAAYPKNDTTTTTIEVYFERLSAYEKPAVLEAIGECMDTSKWFPAISEIIENINSPRGCIHRVFLAEIASKKSMLVASERHSEERLKAFAENIAVLEARNHELYVQDRERLEQSGLPEAKAKLQAVLVAITAEEHTLALVRRKVKLMDQARILQAEEG